MPKKSAAEILAIVGGIGMAVIAEGPALVSAIEDLTDDDKRNDAEAGLEIHAIAGRMTDRIVSQFPTVDAAAIAKMHAGLSDLLEGAFALAEPDDATPEGKTRRRRRKRRNLSPLVGAVPMMRVDR